MSSVLSTHAPSILRFALTFIVIGAAIWIAALRWHYSRVISRVQVTGTNLLRQEEILDIAKLTKLKGTYSASEINTALVERRIAQHPFVKSVSVFLGASDVLSVHIQERTPIALLAHRGRQYYIDVDGHVLPYRLTETVLDLPLLSGFGRGNLDSNLLNEALHIISTLQQYNTGIYRSLSELDIHP
ncbi:MAG: FtsQ-type POTRA domain-containing protein, partial [Bacteroidota bacterium]|nr:FtsQ-type POTRA domain-containing protein [Candidatus Kapabacteria bacterium]MDW8220694.1 FtsQ-type POTRA domain-containing protein [Bacteroidota bacterium]